jgi:hypothetical protein
LTTWSQVTLAVTWSQVTLAIVPAVVTGCAAYFGVRQSIRSEGDRLRAEHAEEARRRRLAIYQAFIDGDRQMREYIKDQNAGDTWEGTEGREARATWHSAMNGVRLFSAVPVREAFEDYQETIAPRLAELDQSPSNQQQWKEMIDVLYSEATINARERLIEVMREEADVTPSPNVRGGRRTR